ncbi:MAG: gamma-glutamyltransferase [Flavobacteriales bacterium]
MRLLKRSIRAIIPLVIGGLAACDPKPTPRGAGSGTTATHAMVVTAHPLATKVGLAVLRDGGNAVDAAIAVHYALAVVLPWAGNIGGGGFMVMRSADGRVRSLDFREIAPAAATRDMYLDRAGQVVPGLSLLGHKAVGVPGTVAGLQAAHDSLGNLPMRRLIQPAIDLATNGFALTQREADELNEALPGLRTHCTRSSAFTAHALWNAGDTLRLPELAATLIRLRDGGSAEFYTGTTADLIIAEMQRGHGLLSKADLATYRPVWRAPVHGRYRDLDVYSMGPPSSGGILLLQLLAAMEPVDVRSAGRASAPIVHRMVEAERRAYADRAEHLGDPDHVPVPVNGLLDHRYILERMKDFDPAHATRSSAVTSGTPAEHEETTHFSIVDAHGDAVACTTTLNGSYGSHVVVGGAGFVLNNEMDDFSTAPGIPNAYGLVGGEANAIAPGRRMLSSMAPTIVVRGGELFMVLGTPGGSTIPTSVFQVFLDVVDHGMGIQEAVSAPRFHHQWLPDLLFMEAGAFSAGDSAELARMGHRLRSRAPIGRVDAIRVLPDGRLEGGADPRGDDSADGY